MANRIEFSGRIVRGPELRVTPAGTAVLNLTIRSADGDESFTMDVTMVGDEARKVAARLGPGGRVAIAGRVRPSRASGGTRLEVVATHVEAQTET